MANVWTGAAIADIDTMSEFIELLLNPDIKFLRYAIIAGLLSSIPLGISGTFIVTRRISYLAAAIAHSILGGIGLSLLLKTRYELDWLQPFHGAVILGIAAAFLLGWVRNHFVHREEAVISVIWSMGMASGLIGFTFTPGYVDPMSYLFGDILIIARSDLWLAGGLGSCVLLLTLLFYKEFMAISFDEEYAKLRGISVERFSYLLLIMTVLTIVLMVSMVGIVLVIALLTLPPAVAGQFAPKLWKMMLVSIILCAILILAGIVCSWFLNLPTGPTIILITGITYLFVLIFARRKR